MNYLESINQTRYPTEHWTVIQRTILYEYWTKRIKDAETIKDYKELIQDCLADLNCFGETLIQAIGGKWEFEPSLLDFGDCGLPANMLYSSTTLANLKTCAKRLLPSNIKYEVVTNSVNSYLIFTEVYNLDNQKFNSNSCTS